MHSKIFAIAAALSVAVLSVGAEAMPAGTVSGASAAPRITLTAGGCGVGFAPGPAGVCRPIRRVIVGPRVVRPVVRVRPRCGVRVPGVAIVTPC